MTRHAHLTVLERGASATAWASRQGLAADDWIVVAQQSDESMADFLRRVAQRATRLRRHDTQLDTVDVDAAPRSDRPSALARREVIETLGEQMLAGSQLTLWTDGESSAVDLEMAEVLAVFQPILAGRQIAMNHQTCDADERSGVRHAIPSAPPYALPEDFDEII